LTAAANGLAWSIRWIRKAKKLLKYIGALWLGMASVAHAEQVYLCDMNTSLDTSVISEQFVFGLDSAAKTAIVNDAVIQGTVGAPIETTIASENARTMVIRWAIDDSNNTLFARFPTFQYRATIFKGTNKITISAKPSGYDNSFGANGTCEIQ
jgi:hypothetical protein